MLEYFLRFLLSVSCSRFPSKLPRPFRLGGWRGGFASYAPVRRAARRRRARRRFGIYKRHIGSNGWTVQRQACGYSTVEKQSTAPRESLLDCSVRSSFWIFSTLRLAASRCLSTE